MNPGSVICQTIDIGGRLITLISKNVHKYICAWHLDTFVNAVFLGTPRRAIETISQDTGHPDVVDFDQAIKSIDAAAIKAIPPLKIFTTDCNVALTEFVINRVSGSRQFSIGLEIKENNHIGPVSIDAVAFRVKLTPEGKKTQPEQT